MNRKVPAKLAGNHGEFGRDPADLNDSGVAIEINHNLIDSSQVQAGLRIASFVNRWRAKRAKNKKPGAKAGDK